MQQCEDFLEVSEAFAGLLSTMESDAWDQPTQFKQWTPNDVIGHLHFWNIGADLSLRDPAAFTVHVDTFLGAIAAGETRPAYTRRWLAGLQGRELAQTWAAFYLEIAEHFANADPKARLRWVGPDMSARSSITARLMETWAHAQAVYDLLGRDRVATNAIRNIVQLGVNTRAWSFSNRGLAVPDAGPLLDLSAPSGDQWKWNDSVENESITGSAFEFCQVVTQVRHVEDTKLKVIGENAMAWMAIAQCFAGAPMDPPPPGTRFKQTPRLTPR